MQLSTSLILASSSPRRQRLLREAGYAFEIDAPQVEEATAESHSHFTPIELARYNAWLKVCEVSSRHPEKLVVAADTLVFMGLDVFGKPANLDDARRMLRSLRGREHRVVTAVACVRAATGQQAFFHVISRVSFRVFSEDELEEYLSCVHVLDKSGAYAFQEKTEIILDRLDGLVSNVIGLPIEKMYAVLKRAY